MYYRNAQAALVVYDLTKPSSLIKAKHWVAELQRQASPGIVIALVGNKLDLAGEDAGQPSESPAGGQQGDGSASPQADGPEGEQEGEGTKQNTSGAEEEEDAEAHPESARKISTHEASSYAGDEGLLFFETSAKSGENVAEVFTAIANAIPETSLKGARGAGAGAGGGQGGLGQGGRPGEDARINLRDRAAATPKDGCAC